MRRSSSSVEVVAVRQSAEGQSQRARILATERPDWGKATSLEPGGSCCWCSGASYKRQSPARDGFDSPTFRLSSSKAFPEAASTAPGNQSHSAFAKMRPSNCILSETPQLGKVRLNDRSNMPAQEKDQQGQGS